MADKWDGKGRREADRGKRNLISDSASTSALVAGDHVSITSSESPPCQDEVVPAARKI